MSTNRVERRLINKFVDEKYCLYSPRQATMLPSELSGSTCGCGSSTEAHFSQLIRLLTKSRFSFFKDKALTPSTPAGPFLLTGPAKR